MGSELGGRTIRTSVRGAAHRLDRSPSASTETASPSTELDCRTARRAPGGGASCTPTSPHAPVSHDIPSHLVRDLQGAFAPEERHLRARPAPRQQLHSSGLDRNAQSSRTRPSHPAGTSSATAAVCLLYGSAETSPPSQLQPPGGPGTRRADTLLHLTLATTAQAVRRHPPRADRRFERPRKHSAAPAVRASCGRPGTPATRAARLRPPSSATSARALLARAALLLPRALRDPRALRLLLRRLCGLGPGL